MKKMRMCFPREKTFADGFAEYVLDCKARNLRDGTIHHYEESIKQIYKRIPPDTLFSSMNRHTMEAFYIALRSDPDINEVTMGTYANHGMTVPQENGLTDRLLHGIMCLKKYFLEEKR